MCVNIDSQTSTYFNLKIILPLYVPFQPVFLSPFPEFLSTQRFKAEVFLLGLPLLIHGLLISLDPKICMFSQRLCISNPDLLLCYLKFLSLFFTRRSLRISLTQSVLHLRFMVQLLIKCLKLKSNCLDSSINLKQ